MTKKEIEAQDIIVHEVEKVVNILHAHLKKFSTDNGATSVPIVYIDHSVKILLENYKKGVHDSRNETVSNG